MESGNLSALPRFDAHALEFLLILDLDDQCKCSAKDAEYRANESAYSSPEEANDGEDQYQTSPPSAANT